MKVFSAFAKQVVLVLVGSLVLGGYPLYTYAQADVIWAVGVGCGVCTLNVIVGCISIFWTFEKPHGVFLKVLFGGMVLRLILIGLAIFILITLTNIHILGLVLSLFVFYFTFQVLEIRFLIGHLPAPAVSKEEGSHDG